MPPVPTLYLDTSVIGGSFDDEWRELTQALWRQMEGGRFRFVTSLVTAGELALAPGHVRELLEATFSDDAILSPDDEAEALAVAYMGHGILPPRSKLYAEAEARRQGKALAAH